MTKIKNKTTGDWEDVANLAQSDSVRNPDWSRKVNIASSTFKSSGYTALEDGLFIIPYMVSNVLGVYQSVYVNGVKVGSAWTQPTHESYTDTRSSSIQVPVSAGDRITCDADCLFENSITFVPYRVQKSVEESHAVIQITDLTVNNSTILPSGSADGIPVAKFVLPKKGVYLITAEITLANTTSTGIYITSPQWVVAPAHNMTATFCKVVEATTDNFELFIKAKNGAESQSTVTSHACQGQAIKLY